MMSQLRIGIIAPKVVLPPTRYGGTERIICWLALALRDRGHQVTITADSRSALPGIRVLETIPEDVDVLHSFVKPEPSWLPQLKRPWLFTLEGNGQPGEVFARNTVFISANHAQRHGGSVFVYNGVNPDDYRIAEKKKNYACFLAKASWKVKNVQGAIDISKRAEKKIWIMGGWRFSLGSGVKWCGMTAQNKKITILSESSALLNPVRWHEPFGISNVEALLSGCPVFGTPYGALPEIVSKEAGVLSTDPAVLASALKSHSFSPQRLRDEAAAKFSHHIMTERYLALYERVLAGHALHVEEPRTLSAESPESLLPWGND